MDALLVAAAALLDGMRSKKWGGAKHLPNCRIGQAVDSYWEAPCSTRCAEVARVLLAVDQRAAAEARVATAQGALFEEAG